MLANFLQDTELAAEFQISFSYRASPAYDAGLRRRVPHKGDETALELLTDEGPSQWARQFPRPLALVLLMAQNIMLLRYWVLAINVMRLRRAWRGKRIDILHINNGGYPAASSARAAAIAARSLGIARVVFVANNIAVRPRWHLRWAEYLVDRAVCRGVSVFVTGSTFANAALQSRLGRFGARFAALHNGIGLRPASETPAETRARLGVEPDALMMVVVALLEWRKGHAVLLDALALLAAQNARLPTVLIEGTGPEEQRLRAQVARLGLQGNIRFIGAEANVMNLMQAADVLVAPSIANEDFPNVILEAMGQSKPVISTRIAGIPEQIDNGVTGWLVAPNDAGALAGAIAQAGTADLQAMGHAAKTRFDSGFTAALAVRRYAELYRSLIQEKRGT